MLATLLEFNSRFINPIKTGGECGGGVFAPGKFKLFLNELWYEPETL